MFSTEIRLLVWWLLFGGTHLLGSSAGVRSRLISALGLRGFKALYSVVALATFVPLVLTYWHDRHTGALLFEPLGGARHATELLMALALTFLVLGLSTPSPMTTAAELSGRFPGEPRGIQRVTRHPSNTGFVIFGAAHCLVNPTVGDWVFFGGFVIYGLVSAVHQDRRVLAGGPESFRAFHAATSLVPFAAILAGRQRLVWRELGLVCIAVALGLSLLLRLSHPLLIGGFGD